MREASIEQLRAKLLEYVRLAHAGERILVTDRDEVIAELGPASRRHLKPNSTTEAILEQLADCGLLTRAKQPKMGWAWRPLSLGLPRKVSRETLNELRKDR